MQYMINIEIGKTLEIEQLLLTKYIGELSLVTTYEIINVLSFFGGMWLNSEIFSELPQNMEGISFHR